MFRKVFLAFLLVGAFALSLIAGTTFSETLEEGQAVLYSSKPGQGFIFSKEQVGHRFIDDFVRWAKEDIGTIPREDEYLFIGSSSMRAWKNIKKDLAPLKVIHRGFGGSTMEHVLVFSNFFARYKAKAIVVYEGDNDLSPSPSSADAFVKNCKIFIDYMKKVNPKVEIHFISPKPSLARWAGNAIFEDAREKLLALTEEYDNVYYIDVSREMLNASGTPKKDIFKRDRLHMNEKGYAIWRKILRKHFDLPPLD